MIKVKEFFDLLCNKFEYRFFTGMPFEEAKSLYSSMSTDFLHYIPATRAESALGMAYGVTIAGFKPCLILPKEEISKLDFYLPLGILIITDSRTKFSNHAFNGDVESLEEFLIKVDKSNKNATISLEEQQ